MSKSEKNVKGFIGLFLALASLILILAATFVPMSKLTGMGFDGKLAFYGQLNVTLVWVGVVMAVAAIVFGAMSKKDADKTGPRKSGVIIGILCIIFGLICALVVSTMTAVGEYINSDGEKGIFAEMVKESKDNEKTMNDIVKALQKLAGLEEKGIIKKSADIEKSTASNTENSSASSAEDSAASKA